MNIKSESQFITDISSLEQIKSLELSIARRIALVEEEVGHAQTNAEERALELRVKIEQQGHTKGESVYADILATAKTRAQVILEQAQNEANQSAKQLPQLIHQTKDYACQLILGVSDKE